MPTAPFVTAFKLEEAYNKLIESSLDSVFPVLEFSFPIQRALQVNHSKVAMVWREHLHTRSQDLELRYHDSGQFYWIKEATFCTEKKLFTQNSGAIIISQLEAQDIDTETDWKLAEMKYKLIYG